MKTFLKKIIPDAGIRACWHLPRAICANIFFGFSGHRIRCIAIAGTKGKTSTAFFLSYILNSAGSKTALFSTATVNDGRHESLNTWKMTTPDVFALHSFLSRARKNHCINAVIEVSSHALKQYRTWGIPFSHVIITNLTPDHLDYHASANEYQSIHRKLISKDTSALIAPPALLFLFSLPHTTRFIPLHERTVDIPVWWAPLQGANVSAAVTAAEAIGIERAQITNAIRTLPSPPGRFEEINAGQPFRVIVDYAHSPESLNYFLSHIRPLVPGKLIVVFGACGDRDREQRPIMGRIIERTADLFILTTDDPYSEDPENIVCDVQRGLSRKNHVCILDRKEAISHALSLAKGTDCICILGKGAEQWQIVNNKRIRWDDRVIVRELLTHVQRSAH